MKKYLFFVLSCFLPGLSFSQGIVPSTTEKAVQATTQATTQSVAESIGGALLLKDSPAVIGNSAVAQDLSYITKGVQTGVLSHLEIPLAPVKIPSAGNSVSFIRRIKSIPADIRVIRQRMREGKGFVSLRERIEAGIERVAGLHARGRQMWELKERENMSDEYFFLRQMEALVLFGGYLSPAQVQQTRAFYSQALENLDMFSSEESLGRGLLIFTYLGFFANDTLAEKMLSLAKEAPEGMRLLTDFFATRAFLQLKDYRRLQKLMDFRQQQEGWYSLGEEFGGGGFEAVFPSKSFAEGKGETVPIYEEIKLYSQAVKKLPLNFPDRMIPQKTFSFAPNDGSLAARINAQAKHPITHALRMYKRGHAPSNSAEGLLYYLDLGAGVRFY